MCGKESWEHIQHNLFAVPPPPKQQQQQQQRQQQQSINAAKWAKLYTIIL